MGSPAYYLFLSWQTRQNRQYRVLYSLNSLSPVGSVGSVGSVAPDILPLRAPRVRTRAYASGRVPAVAHIRGPYSGSTEPGRVAA